MNSKRRVHFLDHNSGMPVDPRVLERFLEIERDCPANPGGLHTAGRRSRAVLEDARRQVAESLGCSPDGVFFLSGATESNNLCVHGLGDPDLPILCGGIEHASVDVPSRNRGRVLLQNDDQARLIAAPPGQPVGALTAVHAQSEVGTIQPIAELGALARTLGVPFHVDAAQSLGRLPLDEVVANADTIALSGHKSGGLRGASALIVRDPSMRPRPLLVGGAQEGGLRPGTTSPSLAAATALACELGVREQADRAERMRAARDAFDRVLAEAREGRRLTPADSLPNTSMWHFPVPDGRALLLALDLAGVQASQGSACTTGTPAPPAVLTALGFEAEDARRCVRFSFGTDQSVEDGIDAGQRVIDVLKRSLVRNTERA
ncbi:MAG: aminotransferase class V-fold PLP-dependent enzyme [Planctomycetota bacterium]